MVMNVKSVDDNGLGIKVEGDLGALQIIEESSDSDEDGSVNNSQGEQGGVSTLSSIPKDLVQTTTAPVLGSLVISNSENVQIGNNTYFSGPVTIKQVIGSHSGIKNKAYQKTEDENISDEKSPSNNKYADKKCDNLPTWQKFTFLGIGAICVTAVCAVVIVQVNSTQSNSGNTSTEFSTGDNSSDVLLIAPGHLRIVSRTDWLAQPVDEVITKIRQPVPWVIITHTATSSCHSQSECVLSVRLMQTFHIESRHWSDIGYNFMVGGDGSAYCGRGWDYVGAHTKGYNIYSIGIAFIGTFNVESPTKHQVQACINLIKLGVAEGKIAKDYKLFAHRQLMSTLSPGDKVYEIISKWPHFVNLTDDQDIVQLIPKY